MSEFGVLYSSLIWGGVGGRMEMCMTVDFLKMTMRN